MKKKVGLIAIGVIAIAMAVVGGVLLTSSNKNNSEEGSTTKKMERETTTKEEKPVDPTDGDVLYPTPVDITSRKTNVEYAKAEVVEYYSTTTNKNRKVSVILPVNYDENKQYPVCYMLHGLGQDNTDWTNASAHIVLSNMLARGEAEEMILVLPNCRARENDSANPPDAFSLSNYQAFDNFINDLRDNLMPFIKENYSIKEGRENTAICGFSMGGRTALYIGLTMQDTFGYVGGFAPAPGVFGYNMNGVTEEGLIPREEFKIADEYAGKTLLMITVGKIDTIVANHPDTYHEQLVKNDVDHMWFKVTGNHDVNVMKASFYNFAKLLFK